MYYAIKVAISAALIVLISEAGKRHTFLGALLASIPLVSVLAMVWLYHDTKDAARVSALSTGVFWLVLPSLALFLVLPLLLRQGLHFYLSLAISIAVTIGCYAAMIKVLALFDVKL